MLCLVSLIHIYLIWTCNVCSSGLLYLQWRQPLEYNNSLDQYVVTLRKIPEQQPRTRLTLPTNKDEIETTISVVSFLYILISRFVLWNLRRTEFGARCAKAWNCFVTPNGFEPKCLQAGHITSSLILKEMILLYNNFCS